MDGAGAFLFAGKETSMRKKELLLAALGLLLTFVLSGCGSALPEGMDEDTVVSAGLKIMDKLVDGDYDAVCDALREDVREQTSAAAIEKMMTDATDGLGAYQKMTDSMATGVTKKDMEPHGIAVLRTKFGSKVVMFRIAFDTDMELIGLDVRRK